MIGVTDRVLSIGRMIVLARLLSPTDFGLFGVCLLALLFVESISRTGLQSALVQKKGDINPYLDTAWTVQLIRGIAIGAILFLGADLTARFFDAPEARTLIRVIAVTLVTRGLYNPGIYYFQKDLEFHKQFIWRMSQGIVSLLLPIPLAFLWHNAWALVVGVLAGDICALVVSYILQPYRPHLRLNFKQVRALTVTGKWFALSSLIGYISYQIDKWGVGNLLGPTFLGLYQVGANMSVLTAELSQTMGVVAFPAFAKLQDSRQAIHRAFLRIWEISASVTLPLAIILFLLAGSIVKVLLGVDWLPAVPAVKILAISSFLSGLIGVCSAFFNGAGFPKFNTFLYIIQIIVTAGLIYPFIKLMGIVGASYSVLTGMVASLPLMLIFLFKYLRVNPKEMAKASLPPLALGLCVLVANSLITLGFDSSTLEGLIGTCAVDVLIFGVVNYVIWWKYKSGLFQILVVLKNSWNTRAKEQAGQHKAEY
jgi:O-antigen/teichoic acid export membrane protein